MSAILVALKLALKNIILAVLTEQFLKEVIVHALEFLATRTDNNVDDEIVKQVKEALKKQ